MKEFKIEITKYTPKNIFVVEAINEDQTKRLTFKEYKKQKSSHSFNIREVGVNGN